MPQDKMILSSKYPARLNLRRGASYNASDKGPISSTSSRFNFNHLLASPPPSPGLPALVPRHGKILPSPKPRRVARGLFWLIGVAIIFYCGFAVTRNARPIEAVGWATHAGDQYEMIAGSELPNFPTPVVVEDKRGRAKWTVSIPLGQEFPLEPSVYADICSQNMEVSTHVADLHTHIHRVHAAHYDYNHVDPYFMDVAEAQAHGLLPSPKAVIGSGSAYAGSIVGEDRGGLVQSDVCEKSLTFVMETHDAGLGKTLMMLWTAYGLAEKEGRSFFIDDSRWAYGKFSNLFQSPPIPKCRPPPRPEMLPCPHHARHLVVSAATAGYTFGGQFNEAYEDPKKMEVERQKPIYDMARRGYDALFNLTKDDATYIKQRVRHLHERTVDQDHKQENGLIVGLHVRHGDRRPYEFQYRDSYVPLDRYSDKAREIVGKKFGVAVDEENVLDKTHSVMVLASDDPDVYDADEVSPSFRAQEQIRLASKEHIESLTATPDAAQTRRFVDETVGWEGGFFAGMFWSLGRPNTIPVTAVESPATRLPPTEEALRLRELVGRAYLMDLAVLGEASDSIVCTISSMGCRILAVMMGWEKAIEDGGFVNIDGDFDWRGISW